MSPEAVDYVAKAEHTLERARAVAKIGHYDGAARDAYSAALSAARAIIFDKTGNATKTHSGTRSQLFHLIEQGLHFDQAHAAFLRESFEIRQAVEYDTEPPKVDRAKAEDFIMRAAAFIAAARKVIEGG